MEYRQLGRSGLTVSRIGLGCNNFGTRLDKDATSGVVEAALDQGINFLDTADTYGESETLLGEALRGRRDRVVIATKFGMSTKGRVAPEFEARGSRRYIRLAVESSLKRLHTEWIDLYQIHEPDPSTPLDETMQALDELVNAGKVRYVGSSNFTADLIESAQNISEQLLAERLTSTQEHFNLLHRDPIEGLIPTLARLDVALIPYFPLASGLLSGKYSRGVNPTTGRLSEPGKESQLSDQRFQLVEAISRFAEARGVEVIDVALGWLASQSMVASVIVGATSPAQVIRNTRAVTWTPSTEDLRDLDALLVGRGEPA